jgi:hypothetical protein
VFCGTVWLVVWPLSAELTAAAHDVERGRLASLGLGTAAVPWFTVHTIFTLRYAALYYISPRGGIDPALGRDRRRSPGQSFRIARINSRIGSRFWPGRVRRVRLTLHGLPPGERRT